MLKINCNFFDRPAFFQLGSRDNVCKSIREKNAYLFILAIFVNKILTKRVSKFVHSDLFINFDGLKDLPF